MHSWTDLWNRYQKGNTGTVKSWVHPIDRPNTVAPVDKLLELSMCKALVRDDGKILSTIDCWDAPDKAILMSLPPGRVIHKADGPYLVERNKRYEL